jgi:hypothetical protein
MKTYNGHQTLSILESSHQHLKDVKEEIDKFNQLGLSEIWWKTIGSKSAHPENLVRNTPTAHILYPQQ